MEARWFNREVMKISLAAAVLALLVSIACGNGRGAETDQNQPQKEPEIPTGGNLDEMPPAVIKAKVQPLFIVASQVAPLALASRDRYLSWAQPDLGSANQPVEALGLVEITGSAERMAKAIELSKSVPPDAEELIALAEAFKHRLSEGEPILAEAHSYYSKGEYRSDGYQRGREMHPKVVSSLNAMVEAGTKLDDEISRLLDITHEAELAASAARDPRSVEYLSRVVYSKAKIAEKESSAADDPQIVARLQPAVNELREAVTNLKRRIEADPSRNAIYFSFVSRGELLITEVSERVRRMKMRPPFSTEERNRLKTPMGWTVPGAMARTQRAFFELRQAYFSLKF